MARIVDTIPAFEAYARKAGLQGPAVREQLWSREYRNAHGEVFDAFFEAGGARQGTMAIARELSRVRDRAVTAAPIVREAIEGLDPAVADALGVQSATPPLHVLMVGTLSVNAAVGKIDTDVAVFHCLEWFQSEQGARILIAHEATHAWHQTGLGEAGPQDDPAWLAFYEGIAMRASRTLVPDGSDDDYFWYGHAGFEDWLPWCREHREQLIERFVQALDDPAAPEIFFGSGSIDGRWRTGFFIADEIVNRIDLPLTELAGMSVDRGRDAVRAALEIA